MSTIRRLFVCIAVLSSTSVVLADTATQPWRVGVTAEQEQRAKALLDQGNALFLDKKYPEALERYRAALAVWNHPAIHFNIVRCMIQLDRPVDASDSLRLALHYGAAPLGDALYSEALAYEKLLAKQIGTLEIVCKQAGVAMTLDGQPLDACPSRQTRRVTPGRHQVVAKRKGFVTQTVEVVVAGADRQPISIALVPDEAAARIVHRWPTWQPWAVLGSGLVVASVGAVFEVNALRAMSDYDQMVRQQCMTGCAPGTLDHTSRTRAERQSQIGVAVISIGAAAAIVGGVMLYLNRGRTVLVERSEQRAQVHVTPTPGGGLLFVARPF